MRTLPCSKDLEFVLLGRYKPLCVRTTATPDYRPVRSGLREVILRACKIRCEHGDGENPGPSDSPTSSNSNHRTGVGKVRCGRVDLLIGPVRILLPPTIPRVFRMSLPSNVGCNPRIACLPQREECRRGQEFVYKAAFWPTPSENILRLGESPRRVSPCLVPSFIAKPSGSICGGLTTSMETVPFVIRAPLP